MGIDEAGDKKRVCTLQSIIGEDAVKVGVMVSLTVRVSSARLELMLG